MLLLYYAALLYFALLCSAKTTVVYSSSYRYEGYIYGISHSPINADGNVAMWSFKAFYIGPVPGAPRFAFVADVSLLDPLPKSLKFRRSTRCSVKKNFVSILETHYPSSEINIAYAQVVEIKDLEPIRDIRLLENKVGQIKLTEEALNEIRMNMEANFRSRSADFLWIYYINWQPEVEAPALPAAGKKGRRKKGPYHTNK